MRSLRLELLRAGFSVVRLPAAAGVPDWLRDGEFCSITRTDEELSVVCESNLPPEEAHMESGWRALKVQGPLEFEEIGILADISDVLAQRKISIFVISTFDTDYILVKEARLRTAVEALRGAGHEVTE